MGLDGGFNTYAYAYQNPINYTDPNGLNPAAAVLIGGATFCSRFPSVCANSARAAGAAIGTGICFITGLCDANEADAGDGDQCPVEGSPDDKKLSHKQQGPQQQGPAAGSPAAGSGL